MKEGIAMTDEKLSMLMNYLNQVCDTEGKSISHLLQLMKILIVSLKQLGTPLEEIKNVLLMYSSETAKSKEENIFFERLMELIESIYTSSSVEQRDDGKAPITLSTLPTINLIISLWQAIMLRIGLEYEKQKLAFIGKDRKDYQEQEALDEANDNYKRSLYRTNQRARY